jgi:hypothetical protein
MRAMKLLAGLAMLLIFAWIGIGCSNPDNANQPNLPNPGDDNHQGDPLDPNIPVPFADQAFNNILDIAFEKDGDLVISDEDTGILLFDHLGTFKRNLSTNTTPWTGLVDTGPGVLDKGKGVIVSGPVIGCAWSTADDDAYVAGSGPFRNAPAADTGTRTGAG